MEENILCRDINGGVHIVGRAKLVKRTSVYGVIVTPERSIVLVRDRTSTGTWDLPGGGVEVGENLLQALRREISEEIDLQLTNDPPKLCVFVEYFYDIDSDKGWESTRHFYSLATSGSVRLEGNADDVLEVKLFPAPYADPVISPVAKEMLRRIA